MKIHFPTAKDLQSTVGWFRNPAITTWDGAKILVNNGISTTVPSTGEFVGFLPSTVLRILTPHAKYQTFRMNNVGTSKVTR